MNVLTSILVTDTNIWIDLYHGGILQEIFHLPYRVVSPDLVKDRELKRPGWRTLESLGLEFIELEADLITRLYDLMQTHRGVSFGDLAALVLVEHLQGVLLTGDNRLRTLAQNYGIHVHGILWVLDTLLEFGLLEPITASTTLELIHSSGAYLPKKEVQKRLDRWKRVG